jgi:hypothetical protein
MHGTYLPIPEFLSLALRSAAAQVRSIGGRLSSPAQVASKKARAMQPGYVGIAVILDRKAEKRSKLLNSVVEEAASLHDVTGDEILIVVPSPDSRLHAQEWILNPQEDWHGVGAAGLYVAGGSGELDSSLWKLGSNRIAELDNPDDQNKLRNAITRSTGQVRDYLGLTEADVPSLVLLSLMEQQMFVFRYSQADDAYTFFKKVMERRPTNHRDAWLAEAVRAVANDLSLQMDGETPDPQARVLTGWKAYRFLPKGAQPLKDATGSR